MLGALAETPRGVGLALIAVVLVAESGFLAGMLLPGSTAVLAAGWLAVDRGLPLLLVIGVVTAATVLGAHLSWWRGRDDDLVARAPGRARSTVARVFAGLRRYPLVVVALAQCVAGTRTLTPRAAVAAGVSYRRFTLAQLAGALVWTSTLVISGATAANLMPPVDADAHVLVPLAVTLLVAALVVRRVLRNRRHVAAAASPA